MGCNSPVIAIAPMSGGKAPGIAPTRTAREDTLFKGVYTKAYNSKDRRPTKAAKELKKK